MKTYYLFTQKSAIFSLFGLLAVITISCGSYQNSSYYDNDGVYGSERTSVQSETNNSNQNSEESNRYAQQFRNMQEDYTYFTDVDNYNSQAQDSIVTVYRSEGNNNYAGWGNNSSNVTINYYNNDWGWGWNNWYSPYWGMGWNWGWNSWYGNGWGWNSWYGPGWGWGVGWNSWYGPGWGWNSWYGNGWGWNRYYGRDVVYNNGIRGGSRYTNPSSGRIGNNTNRRSDTPRPNFSNTRNTTRSQSPRNNNQVTPRDNSTTTPRNTNYSTPRTNTDTRSSTPRTNNYSSPRSSGGSFGGSSGGGGGRSGGGSRGGRG